ncbi:MAG: segregation and condensation protein A [Candidatus Limnocylindrus sp.]|jgi:segregation and condensation protein A
MSRSVLAEGFELPDPAAADIEGVVFRREQGGLFGRSRSYVALGDFSGPYGLLLALIERDELDVCRVPLAPFADEFLRFFAEIPDDRLETLSAFVSVAAQLIVLKSRALLPRPIANQGLEAHDLDDADEAVDLRARLLRYRVFRDAARVLGARLQSPLWQREQPTRLLPQPKPVFSEPLTPVISDPKRLVRAATRIALRRRPLADLALAPVGLKVSIGDRLSAIREAVRERGLSGVNLESLLGDRRDRSFIAVTFLALLELAKRREVEVAQESLWGPIIITERSPESAPEGVHA